MLLKLSLREWFTYISQETFYCTVSAFGLKLFFREGKWILMLTVQHKMSELLLRFFKNFVSSISVVEVNDF